VVSLAWSQDDQDAYFASPDRLVEGPRSVKAIPGEVARIPRPKAVASEKHVDGRGPQRELSDRVGGDEHPVLSAWPHPDRRTVAL